MAGTRRSVPLRSRNSALDEYGVLPEPQSVGKSQQLDVAMVVEVLEQFLVFDHAMRKPRSLERVKGIEGICVPTGLVVSRASIASPASHQGRGSVEVPSKGMRHRPGSVRSLSSISQA